MVTFLRPLTGNKFNFDGWNGLFACAIAVKWYLLLHCFIPSDDRHFYGNCHHKHNSKSLSLDFLPPFLIFSSRLPLFILKKEGETKKSHLKKPTEIFSSGTWTTSTTSPCVMNLMKVLQLHLEWIYSRGLLVREEKQVMVFCVWIIRWGTKILYYKKLLFYAFLFAFFHSLISYH